MSLGAYLFFNGRASEAIEFYTSALGAKVNVLMLYKDSKEQCPDGTPPELLNKIMHAELQVGKSTLCLSDGDCKSDAKFSNFAVSYDVSSDEEAARVFKALSENGTVIQPLGKTFFASSFGMTIDRFGVMWMVIKNAA